jgi:hypothetical protein
LKHALGILTQFVRRVIIFFEARKKASMPA